MCLGDRILTGQKPYLSQYARLIPINPLAGELVAAKLNDDNEIDRHFFVRRRHARRKLVHRLAVSERHAQLVHQLIVPNDAIHRRHLEILRPRGNKNITIKRPQLVFAAPA